MGSFSNGLPSARGFKPYSDSILFGNYRSVGKLPRIAGRTIEVIAFLDPKEDAQTKDQEIDSEAI